jgi:hypothetical protein
MSEISKSNAADGQWAGDESIAAQAPDTPVAPGEKCEACDGKGGWATASWTDPVSGPECEGERCGDCEGTGRVAAPLPAAPAPMRASPEQEAEINAAVKAGRITFEPGWNDPRAAEQAGELPPLPEGQFYDTSAGPEIRFTTKQMHAFRAEGIAAALAARQEPTDAPKGDK